MDLRKRVLTRLVPLLVPACMVDTPVAEGDPDRLGAGLDEWCESMCDLSAECSFAEESCPASCADYFRTMFIGKSDTCTEAALRVMDCIDESSCEELQGNSFCNLRAEEAACLITHGLVVCEDSSTGTAGTAGFGGSMSTPQPESCNVDLTDCADRRRYSLSCTQTGDRPICQCSIDDDVTGRYSQNDTVCPLEYEVRQICGWPLVNPPEDLAAPVSCSRLGAASAGDTSGECEAIFGECSDGRTYEVACTGSPPAVACVCYFDGEAVRTPDSWVGICPYLRDDDEGRTAANYVCGFRLDTIGFTQAQR